MFLRKLVTVPFQWRCLVKFWVQAGQKKPAACHSLKMAPFSKPETVLKQAEGLVSVGQTPAALQSLTEMFSSKRFRSTPIASLEPIMIRFIELCVELRKGRTAKEGLMQYKNITQNTSVQSIETVILAFIQLANAKVAEAQVKADKAVEVLDVDDLEASESPEDVLLGAVSGDQSKDRTDRALVTPWLKFLWESYRSALETLKNNARLEVIYQVSIYIYLSGGPWPSDQISLAVYCLAGIQLLSLSPPKGGIPPTMRNPETPPYDGGQILSSDSLRQFIGSRHPPAIP